MGHAILLDVYKRQLIACSYRCIYRLAAVYFFLYTLARDNVSVNAHTSVSYTHLDVYKRQVPYHTLTCSKCL